MLQLTRRAGETVRIGIEPRLVTVLQIPASDRVTLQVTEPGGAVNLKELRVGETLRVTPEVLIRFMDLSRGLVRLGVTAPRAIPVMNQERWEQQERDRDRSNLNGAKR